MNTFKIYFKKDTVLEIGGITRTFKANTMYGFKFISDKDLKKIRKYLINNPVADFYLTDNLIGCFQMMYGNQKPKDKSTENLVVMNKGRKSSKNKTTYATKSSIKKNLEESNSKADEVIEGLVPPVEETDTIVSESEVK